MKRRSHVTTILAIAALLLTTTAALPQSYQNGGEIPMTTVSVRYIVDDVDAAIAFYTKSLERVANFKRVSLLRSLTSR
jgi:hypothetical protein